MKKILLLPPKNAGAQRNGESNQVYGVTRAKMGVAIGSHRQSWTLWDSKTLQWTLSTSCQCAIGPLTLPPNCDFLGHLAKVTDTHTQVAIVGISLDLITKHQPSIELCPHISYFFWGTILLQTASAYWSFILFWSFLFVVQTPTFMCKVL